MPPQAPITVPLNISAVVTLGAAVQLAVVQHASNTAQFTSGTSGTATATFTNNTAKGNCLVACFTVLAASGTAGNISSVTTNGQPDNWGAALTSNAFMYVDPNSAGGQKIVKIGLTFTGTALSTSQSVAILIDIFEVSSVQAAAIVDQAVGGTQFSDSATFSVTTPVTTSPLEIWFGTTWAINFTANTAITITGPGAPWNLEPQLSSSYQQGGTGTADQFDVAQVTGYQIVNAEAAATFAGTVSGSANNDVSPAIMTLFGLPRSGGAGTAQIGPIHQREVWYPEVISVSVSTNTNESTCRIYAGPDSTQENFVDSTTTGSTGFSTFPTTNRQVKAGEYVFAAWNAGDGGSQGRLVIVGTKVMNSGGPPQPSYPPRPGSRSG
jgi:hypothetical protein